MSFVYCFKTEHFKFHRQRPLTFLCFCATFIEVILRKFGELKFYKQKFRKNKEVTCLIKISKKHFYQTCFSHRGTYFIFSGAEHSRKDKF